MVVRDADTGVGGHARSGRSSKEAGGGAAEEKSPQGRVGGARPNFDVAANDVDIAANPPDVLEVRRDGQRYTPLPPDAAAGELKAPNVRAVDGRRPAAERRLRRDQIERRGE